MKQILKAHKKNIATIGIILGILLCFLGVSIGIVSGMIASSKGRVEVGQISSRSQEFIKNEKGAGGSEWSTVDFEGTSENTSRIHQKFSTPCYSAIIPFVLVKAGINKEKSPCVFEGRVVSPPGRLVIGANLYHGKFGEYSGIDHRKRNPQLYTEVPISYSNAIIEEYITYTEEEGTTVFLSVSPYILTVAFSGMNQAELLQHKDLQTLINSIKIFPQDSATPEVPTP